MSSRKAVRSVQHKMFVWSRSLQFHQSPLEAGYSSKEFLELETENAARFT